MANKKLKLPNTKYAVVNMTDTVGDNTNSLDPLALFTTAYADKIVEAVDFGGVGGGTGGGDVTREQFNNEVQARKDGDETLTTKLNKEIQDRTNADTTLQNNINAEKTARENADATLTSNLNKEIQDRTNADTTLTSNLNKEIQDRTNADTTLQGNIDDEVSARTTAIENINTAITTERNARISADNEINQKLTQKTTELTNKIDNNTSQIRSLNSMLSVYWKTIYPVGSIYVSTSATFNPQTAWGGTWVKTAKGRCLIGANDTYPLGSTGGEERHYLTGNEMPPHGHSAGKVFNYKLSNYGIKADAWQKDGDQVLYIDQASASSSQSSEILTTNSTGGGASHNNMQPYLAVYIWERTA
ncbi:MAG: hypothetical protein MSJ41_08575 [Erysipelotrichaceae bacterium]|nr:hypothetical protein [Erysipelotrichaceae bacterium]